MCFDYTGKTVSPCMCNYCSPYRLLLSFAAYVANLVEELTSNVMDFSRHSACVTTCQFTSVPPSLHHTYEHLNEFEAIAEYTSRSCWPLISKNFMMECFNFN